MELLQLRYFLTVAKMLNISRAAEYHMIPQPAMSQTISRLEKELGVALFDRYKNKLSLTRKGEEFLYSLPLLYLSWIRQWRTHMPKTRP